MGTPKNQSKIPRPINHRTCDFESGSHYASHMNPYVRWRTSNLVGPRLFGSKEGARVLPRGQPCPYAPSSLWTARSASDVGVPWADGHPSRER